MIFEITTFHFNAEIVPLSNVLFLFHCMTAFFLTVKEDP